MSAMASQLISFTIVNLIAYSGTYENFKAQRHWPLWVNSPVTGKKFPEEMASNAKNVSIWWRHLEHSYLPFQWDPNWNWSSPYRFPIMHITRRSLIYVLVMIDILSRVLSHQGQYLTPDKVHDSYLGVWSGNSKGLIDGQTELTATKSLGPVMPIIQMV